MKQKKKLSKKKRKFFIIIACYIATFIVTSLVTTATLSWFSGSTWQTQAMYMGGPVYIYFSDDSGVTNTSGEGRLVTETPPGWVTLYPGMNINFEARAVVEGTEFTKKVPGEQGTITYSTTGAVLRAKVTLQVTDPQGNSSSIITNELYNWIWPQLRKTALADTSNNGVWIFDQLNTSDPESNYFYYLHKGQGDLSDSGDYYLMEVGGRGKNVNVGFLNNAVIQLPPIGVTNAHSDCILKFTIVFEAVQAFFPYEERDLGDPYQGSTVNRSPYVERQDLGLDNPLTMGNGRQIFNESRFSVENGYEPV